jgi:type IV secretory pathway ATPase VirB11/archaellum biosynthesis ATPase
MLGLFKDYDSNLDEKNGISVARNLLISFLNKGIIPTWEDFFQELPLFESNSDLDEIREYFRKLTQWNFLNSILNIQGCEFFFHGPREVQILNLNGKKTIHQIPLNNDDWQLWLEVLSIFFKQNWNVKKPFVSFFGDIFKLKYRISLIHGSTSPLGISKLTLRSLNSTPHDLKTYGETAFIEKLVHDKKNLLIAGSTGSGKTSFLGSLMTLINQDEHLIILEDTFEIPYMGFNQTRFLSGETSERSLKAYLSYSLRLSPDRIFLGEMRSNEVIPFLMAMNTGHKGLMGTIHSSTAVDALYRLALLFSIYSEQANIVFEKIMELLTRNLEYVIFMKDKKVFEVIKILGSDKGTPFFETIYCQEERSI